MVDSLFFIKFCFQKEKLSDILIGKQNLGLIPIYLKPEIIS
jgi:hypothetical protein